MNEFLLEVWIGVLGELKLFYDQILHFVRLNGISQCETISKKLFPNHALVSLEFHNFKHLKTFRKACSCMCKAGSVLAWGKSVVMSEGDRLWKLIHWSLYAEFLCWRTMTIKYWAENCCALWKSLYVTLACCHFNGPETLAIDYSAELRYMRLQLWCTIRQSTIRVRSMDLLGQDYCMGHS